VRRDSRRAAACKCVARLKAAASGAAGVTR
jgi:hypothetical protein